MPAKHKFKLWPGKESGADAEARALVSMATVGFPKGFSPGGDCEEDCRLGVQGLSFYLFLTPCLS